MPDQDKYLFYLHTYSQNAVIKSVVVTNSIENVAREVFINFSYYRLGDKVCSEGLLRYFKHLNPNDKITAIEFIRNTQSLELDAKDFLKHIVHEVIYIDKGGEFTWDNNLIIDSVFFKSPTLIKVMGSEWEPQIPHITIDKGSELIDQYNIPDNFIMFQPLIDAPYNKYRNMNLVEINKLTQAIPMVAVGTKETLNALKPRAGLIKVHDSLKNILSLLKHPSCRLFIGGETGLTLAAGAFRKQCICIFDLKENENFRNKSSYTRATEYSTMPHQHQDSITYKIVDMYRGVFSVQKVVNLCS